MRVLFLGRTRRTDARRGGGIYRSALLNSEALRSTGVEVELANIRIPLTSVPKGTDLVWAYGDMDAIDGVVQACAKASIPLLVNSTYDNTRGRARWLVSSLGAWNAKSPAGVYAAVFSPTVCNDPELVDQRERILCVPKIIRVGTPGPGYAQRSGVCLGELSKLRNTKLMAGFDLQRMVSLIKKKVSAPLTIYGQYALKGAPAGVTVRPRNARGFLGWLATARVLVHVTVNETFAMVPAEAQTVGTPVVYRPMPQSLSSYLGVAAVTADTEEQVAQAVTRLYTDGPLWARMHELTLANAAAYGPHKQGPALRLALEKIL
jgi:hypothetical protein